MNTTSFRILIFRNCDNNVIYESITQTFTNEEKNETEDGKMAAVMSDGGHGGF